MNKLLLCLLGLINVLQVHAQTFYVEQNTNKKYEQPVINKLYDLGYKVRSHKDSSDYTIKCMFTEKGSWGVPTVGYIIILDSKTEDVLKKSNPVKLTNNIFKGFQNPHWLLMGRIANKYLEGMIQELK